MTNDMYGISMSPFQGFTAGLRDFIPLYGMLTDFALSGLSTNINYEMNELIPVHYPECKMPMNLNFIGLCIYPTAL